MAKTLALRRESLEKALCQLATVIDKLDAKNAEQFQDELRDSTIQRFEFCIDTLWKYVRTYLEEVHTITMDVPTPRRVFKALADIGHISNDEYGKIIKAVEDRNMTSHTYNEELAQTIFERIPGYCILMQQLLERCTHEGTPSTPTH
jgi:nucleotidyltransferase substrate binding protein (TIGR01987 family)